MSSIAEAVLSERREALRSQLRAQRRVIAHQLDIARVPGGVYPRSVIMRLLTRGPAGTAGRLAELALLLLGSRSFRLLAAACIVHISALRR